VCDAPFPFYRGHVGHGGIPGNREITGKTGKESTGNLLIGRTRFGIRDTTRTSSSASEHSPPSLGAPLLHKCGLTNDSGEYRYNFHMLRHAAASLFIAYLKWPPKRIQTVMGHANVALTFDLYGHLFEDAAADREDMKKLEAAVRVA